MEYKRYENETEDELIYRICSQKEQIGTRKEVRDILNNLLNYSYNESTYRKKYQYFNKLLYANSSKFSDSEAQLETLREEKRELEKLKKQIQTEKIEYNKWLREEARDKLITEKIVNAIKDLPSFKYPKYIKNEKNDKSYLLCFGDAHYGIEFEIKDLLGKPINSYSPEIFEDRMNQMFTKVVDLINKENITELNIFELGDGIQGILRLNSQLMKLRYGIIDSAIKYADYISCWLNELSNYTKINFHMVVDSNHNQLRICNAPKNAFEEENMSKVMLLTIKERLKNNPNINIIENPTGFNYTELCGYKILGIHGEVKNLANSINEFSRALGNNLDYLIGAHCHHMRQEEVGINSEVLTIRSIVGVDPYGISLRKCSDAGASLYVFEDGLGKTCEYTIKLR